MQAALRSRVVVYVTTGQLYRKEVEFVEQFHYASQSEQALIVLLNMVDLKKRTMTKADQRQQFEALAAQLTFVPRHRIQIGAAAPIDGCPPELNEFRSLLDAELASHL